MIYVKSVLFMLSLQCRLAFSSTMLSELQVLERDLNSSILLERSDKELMRSWSQEFQLQQVNVTTDYRMQMLRHRNHVFRRNDSNLKWIECLNIYSKERKKMESCYYDNETNCLKDANSADIKKKNAVKLVGKQLRLWRKGYRYLKKLCQDDFNSEIEDFERCLLKRVQTDNYDATLQRLLQLKIKIMAELLFTFHTTIDSLGNCLRVAISKYLDDVRKIMATLDKCYSDDKS